MYFSTYYSVGPHCNLYFSIKQASNLDTSLHVKQNHSKEENNRGSEKNKNRTKKYSLSSLVKLKRQKESSLFPPPMKEPKFKCDVCGKMWKTRGELNAHKITHSDARPYICEICGQVNPSDFIYPFQ